MVSGRAHRTATASEKGRGHSFASQALPPGVFEGDEQKDLAHLDRRALHAPGISLAGNVRELKNSVERAMLAATNPELRVENFVLPGAGPVTARQELSLAEIERQHILRVLDLNGGNRKRTAEALDINRATLYYKLKSYGIAGKRDAGEEA